MLYATGQSRDALEKQGVALASSKTMGNTKEATVGRTADGHWRLWYEYAAENASRVGLAIGPGVAGPWDEQPTPFLPRPNSWDNWHLSTGPMLMNDPTSPRSEEHTSELQSLIRIPYPVFCLKKKKQK